MGHLKFMLVWFDMACFALLQTLYLTLFVPTLIYWLKESWTHFLYSLYKIRSYIHNLNNSTYSANRYKVL